jgi:hypothetical protein
MTSHIITVSLVPGKAIHWPHMGSPGEHVLAISFPVYSGAETTKRLVWSGDVALNKPLDWLCIEAYLSLPESII